MDVREYSEKVKAQLTDLEAESISDVLSCQEEIAELYLELSKSSKILYNLETTLSKFQKDLGNISSEIKTLQEQSQSMSVSLKNRKELDTKLGSYLQQITLSPSLIDSICNKDIDGEYINYINELREKLVFFKNENKFMTSHGEITALSMQEVFPEIRRLNTKAAGKIRAFILNLIQSLNKPKANVQNIQESVLLKYKNLLVYLRENSPESFVEICMNYNEILSNLYMNQFKLYLNSIKKMIKEDSSKSDLVCYEHMDLKSNKVAGFDLKNRDLLIQNLENIESIVSPGKKDSKKYYIEEVFHSVVRILSDTCAFNYNFVLEFFIIRPDQFQPVFGDLFAKTFQMIVESFGAAMVHTYDILGLLMVLKVNSCFQSLAEKRGVYMMNVFFEKVRIVVWPKIQSLLDNNLKEMENAKYLRTHDVSIHVVTMRFTQFIMSLHKTSPDDNSFDMCRQRFSLFKKSFIGLLEKVSSHINDKKNRLAFMINNLDYLLEEFENAQVALVGEFANFDNDFDGYVESFIELQLLELFNNIVLFKLEDSDVKKVETILLDFNSNWRRTLEIIETIEKDVFISEASKKDILKRTFTAFLMRYSDFVEKVKKNFPTMTKLIVSVHSLMSEIQR